ncbi:unnamed protein product [Adineta steineri]|uniref:F-box domain-containing protein n=1 Tax=Adineta steineri TaxID=433720 RepID=A0A815B3R0_9BILA|nr:unnamed protein product [Adineta steineri]CAF1553442.1 unnamed protein product [Adineta steineri]
MASFQVITDLPNTILLDIIQYLSPADRYRSLHNINHTLDAIIRSSTTHISLSKIESRRDFDYHLEHILPDVINSLRSIKISNDFVFDKKQGDIVTGDRAIMIGIIKKVQAKMNLVAYDKLEEITMENVNATQLKVISTKLVNIPHLKRLIISFYGTIADISSLICNSDIIRSKLTTLNLTLSDDNILYPSSTFMNILSNLEYLTIDSCRVGNVAVLLQLASNIKYLKICIWDFPDQTQTYPSEKLTLPNLTCLILEVDEVKWCFVEHLLKQCGEKLKHFTFTNFWHQLNVYIACDWIKGSSEEDGDIAHVYSVPSGRSTFLTSTTTVNVISPSLNSCYDNIRTLQIMMDQKLFRGTKHRYINVDWIILECLLWHNSDILSFLNCSVNCNNIHHLEFKCVRAVLKPQVFCQLLQQCPNLYSLRLHSKILDEMTKKFSDDKTRLLLHKMIKHLQFNTGLEQEDINEQVMERFVQTFTNLERLFIHIKTPDDILKKLSKILICGGSSATGLYAIQLAKAVGAYVTATCSHRNFSLMEKLGYTITQTSIEMNNDQNQLHVIDYTEKDFGEELKAHHGYIRHILYENFQDLDDIRTKLNH